jgi:hypothetical protein
MGNPQQVDVGVLFPSNRVNMVVEEREERQGKISP